LPYVTAEAYPWIGTPQAVFTEGMAMAEPPQRETTRILLQLSRGELDKVEATDRLFEHVFQELRRLASGLMQRERPDHTLQPTALVNEAYLRLVDGSSVEWQDRAHFFGVATRAMRQILVEHARRHAAAKRGGGWQRITLDDRLGLKMPSAVEILDLDRVLVKLSEMDARAGRVVELRVFGGMTMEEIAHILDVSERTIYKDWHFAKMWLSKELAEEDHP
jgi:RNA polymerase sigma factor (TIGR02999 family)